MSSQPPAPDQPAPPARVHAVGAAADLGGLICAFELSPVKARGIDVLSDPRTKRASASTGDGDAGPIWLHFNLSDSRACRWLEEQTDIPPAAQELLLDTEARIQLVVLRDGLAAVVGDLHHDYRGDPEDFGVLRIYLDGRRLITARSHPLQSIDRLRRELLSGEAELASPIAAFEHLLECLATTFSQAIARLADDTDDTEEEILAGQLQQRGRSLGQMRRLLARLRRQITANRGALAPISTRSHELYSAEQRQLLRLAVERFDAIAQDLELVQERARLLQEELAGRISEATNRNLFVLSILTTTLLPITLITGVFGMNVGGLPWVSDGGGFWWVMLLMLACVITVLLILRRRSVL